MANLLLKRRIDLEFGEGPGRMHLLPTAKHTLVAVLDPLLELGADFNFNGRF